MHSHLLSKAKNSRDLSPFWLKIARGLGLTLLGAGVSIFGPSVNAAEDYISCRSATPSIPETVEGKNLDQLYPIASISKVMTTYWAVYEMGVQGRFPTRFYFQNLEKGKVNLHIEGSRDPYTDQAMFQFVVGQLNRAGIREVGTLSFDENFKFRRDLRGRIAFSYLENDSPKPDTVLGQMKQMMVSLKSDYEIVRVKSQAYLKMTLPKNLQLKAQAVKFLAKAEFDSTKFHAMKLYESAPLEKILKEMNRNSNNHAATQIFEALGGSQKFSEFIRDKVGLTEKDILFFNGSGNRLDIAEGKSVYNMATCRAILKVNEALARILVPQKSSFEKVIAVAGRTHKEDAKGTLDRYNSDLTEGLLVAKTGTVARAVTLAGLYRGKKEDTHFAFIYRTDYNEGDWARARSGIFDKVQSLAKSVGQGDRIRYRPSAFLPFDAKSAWK